MDRRLAASSVGHPESDSRKVCPGRSSGTRITGDSWIVLSAAPAPAAGYVASAGTASGEATTTGTASAGAAG